MIFIYKNKKYLGKTAVQIIRAIEGDAVDYSNNGGSVQDFLAWSLAQLADHIPLRELDVSKNLGDETIAFDYLCLLDNYEIGVFYDMRPSRLLVGNKKRAANRN